MERNGYEVILIGNYNKLYEMLKNGVLFVDMVFNTAEGIQSRNREGWIPSLLETHGIPIIGTDAYGLSFTLNKAHTKVIARYLGILTPNFYEFNVLSDIERFQMDITYPCILKPNCEGTSTGVTLVENPIRLREACSYLLSEYRQTILCETYIDGREISVAVIGNGENARSIGVVETVRKNGEPIGIYDTKSKYSDACAKKNPERKRKDFASAFFGVNGETQHRLHYAQRQNRCGNLN